MALETQPRWPSEKGTRKDEIIILNAPLAQWSYFSSQFALWTIPLNVCVQFKPTVADPSSAPLVGYRGRVTRVLETSVVAT